MSDLKNKDFIEINFTGYVNGRVFDSNIAEDLKTLNPESEPRKTIIAIGERMLVKGLDDFLPGKEIGKEYEVNVSPSNGFGERNRNLVKTIPLRVFTEQRINPVPGAALIMDNKVVKITAVSGARVITDFNHPLAGKELTYKITITRKVDEDKEKAESLFDFFLGKVPEFEINEKIVVKGPKQLEAIVKIFNEKFKDLIGKELSFEEVAPKSEKEAPKSLQ